MAEPRYLLYGTSGCHLCAQAEAVLAAAARAYGVKWQAVDIALDDDLLARYGERIPVLRDTVSGRELGWPFGLLDVVQLAD